MPGTGLGNRLWTRQSVTVLLSLFSLEWETSSSAPVVVVQSLGRVQLFETLLTAVHQASLSFTNSWNLLKLMSIELVSHPTISSFVAPFPYCPEPFPASGSFPMSQLFPSGGQRTGASASESVFPVNIQDWVPLGLIGLISLLSKGLPRVFSSTTIQKYQFFSAQPSLWSNSHIHTWPLVKP